MVWCPIHYEHHHGLLRKHACALSIEKSISLKEAYDRLNPKQK